MKPLLHYKVIGKGTPLVMIHGFAYGSAIWRNQLEGLSHRCMCIAVDLRGHGESSKSSSDYSLDTFSSDISRVLDELGIEKTVVMGWSMGGFVALRFYLNWPQRVIGLILVSVRTVSPLNINRLHLDEIKQIGYKEHIRLATLRSIHARVDSGVFEEIVNARLKTPKKVALKILDTFKGYNPLAHMPDVKVPTLIIVGRNDIVTPVSDAEYLHKLIAHSQLEILENCGHLPMIENPTHFNVVVSKFLDGVDFS